MQPRFPGSKRTTGIATSPTSRSETSKESMEPEESAQQGDPGQFLGSFVPPVPQGDPRIECTPRAFRISGPGDPLDFRRRRVCNKTILGRAEDHLPGAPRP